MRARDLWPSYIALLLTLSALAYRSSADGKTISELKMKLGFCEMKK